MSDQLEVVPVNVFMLHMSRSRGTGDFGKMSSCGLIPAQYDQSYTLFIWWMFGCFSLPGFAVTGHIDNQRNSRIFVSEVLLDGLAFSEGAYLYKIDIHNPKITCSIIISASCDFYCLFAKVRVCVFAQVCVQVMRFWCWMAYACQVWTWHSFKRCSLSQPSTWAWGGTVPRLPPQPVT